MNKRFFAPAAMLAACLALAAGLLAYCGLFLAPWHSTSLEVDLLGDGRPVSVTVSRRKADISREGQPLLTCEPAWLVQDALCGDLDGDGLPELLLLVWKRGSYGDHLPFWVERNDTEFSQHIFIYGADRTRTALRPLWMSSALTPRVKAWSLNENGTLNITTPKNDQTLWHWSYWGLTRLDGARIAM